VALLLAACSDDEPTDSVASAELANQPIVLTRSSTDREGSADLWVIDPDGGRTARLTSDGGNELGPAWSPDGKRVAFWSEEGKLDADIEVIGIDGGHRVQLTATDDTCESEPSWSPDGRSIVFSSVACGKTEVDSQLSVMGSDGANPRTLVKAPALGPDWSPDGTRIVYTGPNAAGDASTIWVCDADGANAEPFPLRGINSPSEPSWSPDGRLIAFVSPSGTYDDDNPATWNEDVYVMNSDGTDIRRVTTDERNDHWPPAWSPDGRSVIYSNLNADLTQDDLMSVDIDTLKVTRLTDTSPASEAMAGWRW
jgi:TolB protein